MKDRLTKVIRALEYGMVAGIFIFLQANLCLAASDEVKIGASISLSGKLTREGHGVQRGYDFWADWVNAKGGVLVGGKKFRVKMVYYDDESNPQTSAKLFEKLITQDRVDIILGPYASGIAMAATTVAERHRYVVILPINNSDEIYNRGYKYVFGQAPVASRDMVPMIDLLMDAAPKPKTLAIIASNSTYPLIVANGCNDYAKKVGLDVVFFEKFPEETSDLSSLLSVIKTKNPDLLIEAGYFEHSVLITKQLKDLGATPRGLVFSIGPQLPDFVKSLGKDAEYALGGAYWHMKMKYKDPAFTVEQYDEMFKQKYGEYPMYLNGYATAAGRLLERALEKAGTIEQEKIREALSKIELTDTIIGKVKFDEGGRNIWGKIGVLQIQKGRDEIVYPHEAATSKLIYPNVPWGQR